MRAHSILFLISFFIGCNTQDKPASISIRWQNNKAAGLVIPEALLKDQTNIENRLKIQLIKPGERTAILGEIKSETDQVIFEPLVPFTKGLRYEIRLDNNLLAEIEIPKSESGAPKILAIYPSQDTVPENLLKVYFHFSQPMAEGRSLSYVSMLNNDDTLVGTFLDLQPELWNTEGTMLTLWLDPGRIKRDLIPNQEMGTPLKAGEKYTLHISSNWKNKEGTPLQTSYSKTFVTASRDEQMPIPDQWSMNIPTSGTTQPLTINLNESLDYSVLMEAIQIINAEKNSVPGTVQLTDEESIFIFTPHMPWEVGEHTIQIEARLEDLAGNNLNRPFDRDVTKKKKGDQEFFKRVFVIQ